MKAKILVISCLVLAGCEYKTPLTTSPEIPIDESVIGLWQRQDDEGKTEYLLVLPMSEREYMVSYPAGAQNAMFARACLWKGCGMTLVQLDWFGTAKADLPKDNRRFQFAAYAAGDRKIGVRLLNPDAIGTEATSPEELAKAIENNKDNPGLFRKEMIFDAIRRQEK